jgi:hypothetical protein
MIEVHIGTPNQMECVASKTTQSAAVKWAKDYLEGMKRQAEKFDRAALDDIQRVKDELNQVTVMAPDAVRSWSFPYISVTFRIELRNNVSGGKK